jgi:hypothetical protein
MVAMIPDIIYVYYFYKVKKDLSEPLFLERRKSKNL